MCFAQLCTTGAVSLMGGVWKIEGLDMKAQGAAAREQRRVVVPQANNTDVEGLPAELRHKLNFFFVSDVSQLLKTAISGEGCQLKGRVYGTRLEGHGRWLAPAYVSEAAVHWLTWGMTCQRLGVLTAARIHPPLCRLE